MNGSDTMKPTVVVLAALLVASGITGGVVAFDPGTDHTAVADGCGVDCSVQVAQFDPVGARNNTETAGPSAGAALSVRRDGLEDRIETLVYQERLTKAKNETQVHAAELRRLRTQADELEAREAAALAGYDDRNTSAKTLLVELVRIDAEARRLDDRRAAVSGQLTDLTVVGVDTRALRGDLLARQGPVRYHTLQRFTGDAPTGVVEVTASRQYVALATTGQQEGVLERYQADYRDRPSSGPVTIEAAGELVAAQYPAEWNNRTGYTIRQLDTNLLYVELEHTEGAVVVYIDRPSARVFKEFQYTLFGPESEVTRQRQRNRTDGR